MSLKTHLSSSLSASCANSPCIRNCFYDHDKDFCTGCGRTLGELTYWNDYTNQEKKEILEKCKKRLDDQP